MSSSGWFPVPVRSAVKPILTIWSYQNLSTGKRALNALTVQVSTAELGKLFQHRALVGQLCDNVSW